MQIWQLSRVYHVAVLVLRNAFTSEAMVLPVIFIISINCSCKPNAQYKKIIYYSEMVKHGESAVPINLRVLVGTFVENMMRMAVTRTSNGIATIGLQHIYSTLHF